MKIINISSQEEFGALPLTSMEDREIHIHDAMICLCFSYQCTIRCYGNSRITLSGPSRYDERPYLGHSDKDSVAAYDNTVIHCLEGRYLCDLECHGHVFVDAKDTELNITAEDACTVLAGVNCIVNAFGRCHVTVFGMARIMAHDQCSVSAFSEANITLYDESRLTAADHCQVQAYGNSKVSISSASCATLYDQAELTSFTNGFVRAFDNSTITLPSENADFRRYLSRIYAHDQSKVQGGQDLKDIEVMDPEEQSIGNFSAASFPEIIHIETQEELDAISPNSPHTREIHIHGTAHILVEDYYDCVFHCFDEVFLELCFTNRVVAHENSGVSAGGHCIVEALDRSEINACECCHVLARNRSTVSVKQEASVIGRDHSSISILRRHIRRPSCCRVYTYDHSTVAKNECPETSKVFKMCSSSSASEFKTLLHTRSTK